MPSPWGEGGASRRVTDPAQAQELFTRTREKLRGDTRAAFDQRFGGAETSAEDPDTGQGTGSQSAESPEAGEGSANRDEVDDDQGNEDNNQEEIEWNEKPSEQVYDGRNEFNVDGPIKIDMKSVTPLDGIEYEVDWYALDKEGKVIPQWRTNEYRPKRGGGHNLFFDEGDVYHPTTPSEHGYRVIIRIPPQPNIHGNSTGVHLDVYSPKGSGLDKVTDK